MDKLASDRRARIIGMMVEGVSIRAIMPMTGVISCPLTRQTTRTRGNDTGGEPQLIRHR